MAPVTGSGVTPACTCLVVKPIGLLRVGRYLNEPGMIPESPPAGMVRGVASTIRMTAKFSGGKLMRRSLELLSLVWFGMAACNARAELSPPNAAGVAMGHLHYVVRDVDANKAFWVALGGRSVLFNNTTQGIVFPDVVVLLRQGEPS